MPIYIMELPKIPPNEIYKICFLNESGIYKTLVFSGNSISDSQNNKIFSEDNIPIHSEHQIHRDDSIYNIKKKIIHALGMNDICYEEIYMFINTLEKFNPMDIFQAITKGETISFTTEQLKQFLINVHFSIDEIDAAILQIKDTENVTYDDLKAYLAQKSQNRMSS